MAERPDQEHAAPSVADTLAFSRALVAKSRQTLREIAEKEHPGEARADDRSEAAAAGSEEPTLGRAPGEAAGPPDPAPDAAGRRSDRAAGTRAT